MMATATVTETQWVPEILQATTVSSIFQSMNSPLVRDRAIVSLVVLCAQSVDHSGLSLIAFSLDGNGSADESGNGSGSNDGDSNALGSIVKEALSGWGRRDLDVGSPTFAFANGDGNSDGNDNSAGENDSAGVSGAAIAFAAE